MAAQVSFANDIKVLFTDIDVDHMSWFCDLRSYDDVKANADDIYNRLQGIGGKRMPPPPAQGWPQANIDLFKTWMDQGYPA
jgi:hypothetical protein